MNVIVVILLVLVAIVIAMQMYKYFVGEYTGGIFGGKRPRVIYIQSQEPWFGQLKSGKKTVEARAGKPDFYKEHIGSEVTIRTLEGGEHKAKIKEVRHYETLEDFIKKEGWKKVAPHVKSEQEAIDSYLTIKNKAGAVVYDKARIKELGGVTAIEFM